MTIEASRRDARRARSVALLLGSGLAAAMGACSLETAAPVGTRGVPSVEPRAGAYVVAEFGYLNTCAEPDFGLSDRVATERSATFELWQDGDHTGAVALAGTLRVAHPTPGRDDIVILEGPDTGWYRIAGDTLRLFFPKTVNEWVGVLRFARYHAGQLAGSSQTSCRSLSLRMARQP